MPKRKPNTAREWHSGRPPHIGWWNASAYRDRSVWRWWDGRRWSQQAKTTDSAEYAAGTAERATMLRNHEIEWTHDYPKGARVPRQQP